MGDRPWHSLHLFLGVIDDDNDACVHGVTKYVFSTPPEKMGDRIWDH